MKFFWFHEYSKVLPLPLLSAWDVLSQWLLFLTWLNLLLEVCPDVNSSKSLWINNLVYKVPFFLGSIHHICNYLCLLTKLFTLVNNLNKWFVSCLLD
jgi:hypothetical protein